MGFFCSSSRASGYWRGNTIKMIGHKVESHLWKIMEHVVLSDIHGTQRQTTSIEATDLGIVTLSYDVASMYRMKNSGS